MRNTRITIFVVTVILICIGIVMIYSASGIYALEKFGDSLYYLKKHLFYLILGLILSIFVMGIDLEIIRRYSPIVLAVSILLLLLSFVPGIGHRAGGASRWLKIGNFTFQPSEAAKIAFVIYISDFLSRKQSRVKNFVFGFLPITIVMLIVVGLVLIQPDLGTAILLGIVFLITCFAAGINFRHVSALFLGSVPVLYSLIFTVPYRKKRILAFMNPWSDVRGVGYQIIQSFIALGSGGLLGLGLGQSRQKLFYLPASHTDFIFAIIGEELGLLAAAAILILFGIFIWQSLKVARQSANLFGKFLCLSIASMIALEAIINIAVVTGAIPTKGLPLPFISYGGSALVFNMAGVALILNIARDKNLTFRI